MSKICMFGISGSGKTCYLYAMAQVMNNGVRYGDSTHISVISNDLIQQQTLFDGYYTMAAKSRWPEPSNNTTEYDFNVRVHYNHRFEELIPSLLFHDYAGGVWQNATQEGEEQRKALLSDFSESAAILFILDSDTILKAMSNNPQDIDCTHRDKYAGISTADILRAKQQVSLVENLLRTYKQSSTTVPPVLLVITKGDKFASKEEENSAYNYLIQTLPSIFAKGSRTEAAITTVALGDNLETINGELIGDLDISIGHNVHIPLLFALYAYLSDVFDGCSPDEQDFIDDILPIMRKMFADKIVFFNDGKPQFAI